MNGRLFLALGALFLSLGALILLAARGYVSWFLFAGILLGSAAGGALPHLIVARRRRRNRAEDYQTKFEQAIEEYACALCRDKGLDEVEISVSVDVVNSVDAPNAKQQEERIDDNGKI